MLNRRRLLQIAGATAACAGVPTAFASEPRFRGYRELVKRAKEYPTIPNSGRPSAYVFDEVCFAIDLHLPEMDRSRFNDMFSSDIRPRVTQELLDAINHSDASVMIEFDFQSEWINLAGVAPESLWDRRVRHSLIIECRYRLPRKGEDDYPRAVSELGHDLLANAAHKILDLCESGRAFRDDYWRKIVRHKGYTD